MSMLETLSNKRMRKSYNDGLLGEGLLFNAELSLKIIIHKPNKANLALANGYGTKYKKIRIQKNTNTKIQIICNKYPCQTFTKKGTKNTKIPLRIQKNT